MAGKAAQSLGKKLKKIPEVTHVTIGSGEIIHWLAPGIPVLMLILRVCTSSPESQKIKNLPSRFGGFRVEQLNLGDKRDAFLATLKCCLKELKGWNETKTMKWVKQRDLIDALQGGCLAGPVYSHGPVKEALACVLDERIRKAVKTAGNDFIYLRNDLLSVLWNAAKKANSSECDHLDKIKNYNWKVVRKNIKDVIEKYCRAKQQN